MAYSDDEIQFKKDLIDIMYDALKDMASAGGVKKIRKGDFYAEYRSPYELQSAIKELETSVYFLENGCRRTPCQ